VDTTRNDFARSLIEVGLRRRLLRAAVGSSRPVSSGVTFWLSQEPGLPAYPLAVFLSRPTAPHGLDLAELERAVELVEQAFQRDPRGFRARLYEPPAP
jgi:hypothetical protein